MKFLNIMTEADTFQNLRKTSLTVGGSICTAGGFVADVLQPIAPFAYYLFLVSLAGLAVVLLLFLRGNKNLLGVVVMAAMASGVFGLLTLLQAGDESQESGFVASTVPAIASLQQSLGIIDQKLDDIKDDTETIKASTARLEDNSEAMLASLEAIRKDIGKGGLIAKPNSPEEHYHNARVNELGGNYSAARRSYLEFFRGDLSELDPHLRFISFLKVQEGTAGARETYNTVTDKSTSPIPAYVRLLLREPGQRSAGLQKYLEEHPEFAPAAYHLSLEYSERRLGSQTLSDKRQELKFIKSFQQIDTDGGLLRYMIDQELVKDWREDAETRRLSLEGSAAGGLLENPVSLTWMANNAGWNGNIQISEPVKDIEWNIKGQTQPRSTGSSGYNDPTTGKPAPRAFFSLQKNQKKSVIEIRYTDLADAKQGPFEFTFEPKQESEDVGQRMLEMTETSWLSFRDYDGKALLYFTHLMVYRGSIEKIEYGLDRATPNKRFKFPAWNKSGIATIDAKTPSYIKVSRKTSYASLQLTYKNGEKSPIVRFDR